MDMNFRRYPIGIQNFEQLRNDNYVYVDKTPLVYKLANTNTTYFLSRPRRFGKSLLVSTLEAYFQGKKELFTGLAMETLEKEWTVYPVLHIDFSISKYVVASSLRAYLHYQLALWEKVYGKSEDEGTFSLRFGGVIRRAYEQTGKRVVILIDEYDSPMLDSNNNEKVQSEIRNIMRDFFSPLKSQGQYLRFLFLTGISKFSQMSIFSELNNLQNISMWDEYSAICGITEEELRSQMQIDIEQIAQANSETYEEACAHLKQQYDGYHFSKNCADIYNPFSLINAFTQKSYENFWFSTGTPTFLIDLLQESDFDIRDLDATTATAEQFDAPSNRITDPLPVLYQSGYLTIKGYDPDFQAYTLGYPNKEVRKGFIESLMPAYVHLPARENTFYVISFIKDLRAGKLNECLERMKSFFASIPNKLNNKEEKHYQTIFYLFFRLMGQYIDVEVDTAIGRADAVVKMQDAIYVFEFKVDGTPEEALAQINSKGYAIPYHAGNLKIIKIGVNFDSATRTIGDWKIEE
ncbi:ATP-binding protein [Bacteroides congonensis]|uniref:ATP-binding protein n=1 Tax=Bacteroides congonensis TaxID=1871006 RepID=UPI00189C4216|nr:ATP-binding protein [Bacteroides congonensis]